jgi:hypothetical protein
VVFVSEPIEFKYVYVEQRRGPSVASLSDDISHILINQEIPSGQDIMSMNNDLKSGISVYRLNI